MRIIDDQKLMQTFIEEDPLFIHLQAGGLPFSLFYYEKREIVETPVTPTKNLLFLVSGQLQIYDIGSEGEKTPVGLVDSRSLLGDLEFCRKAQEPFFVETLTPVYCLALPIESQRSVLERDPEFMLFLAYSLAGKLERIGQSEIRAKTVRERVLHYMKYVSPDGVLKGMEKASMQICCSRRQLQRVLSGLCASGEIRQIGRGTYQISRRSI